MTTDFRHFAVDEILSDGSPIRVRAVRPDDGERLQEHFRTLSPESVYFRFFGMKKRLSLELREMDLNPVKVREPGRGAVVVDARMRIEPG